LITGDHLQADYAILFSRSAAFPDLLTGVRSTGMLALTPFFVDDCIDAGLLLEVDPARGHVIDSEVVDAKLKKGKSKPALTPAEERARKDLRNERMQKRRAERRASNTSMQQVPGPSGKANGASANGLLHELPLDGVKTPPLPEVNERMRMPDGRWLYAPEEKEFALKYGHVLIQRDPKISNSAIAMKLSQKVSVILLAIPASPRRPTFEIR
jgi:hypothetical protein